MLVLDQERLYSDLSNDITGRGKPAQVIKLNKSGGTLVRLILSITHNDICDSHIYYLLDSGVVTRDTEYRRKTRNDKIREYFYGPTGDLCPHSTIVDFDDVILLRVGGTMMEFYQSSYNQ